MLVVLSSQFMTDGIVVLSTLPYIPKCGMTIKMAYEVFNPGYWYWREPVVATQPVLDKSAGLPDLNSEARRMVKRRLGEVALDLNLGAEGVPMLPGVTPRLDTLGEGTVLLIDSEHIAPGSVRKPSSASAIIHSLNYNGLSLLLGTNSAVGQAGEFNYSLSRYEVACNDYSKDRHYSRSASLYVVCADRAGSLVTRGMASVNVDAGKAKIKLAPHGQTPVRLHQAIGAPLSHPDGLSRLLEVRIFIGPTIVKPYNDSPRKGKGLKRLAWGNSYL